MTRPTTEADYNPLTREFNQAAERGTTRILNPKYKTNLGFYSPAQREAALTQGIDLDNPPGSLKWNSQRGVWEQWHPQRGVWGIVSQQQNSTYGQGLGLGIKGAEGFQEKINRMQQRGEASLRGISPFQKIEQGFQRLIQ